MLTIPFPAIDPVAIEIGPVVIRWYALAYLAGFILGWRYCVWLARRRGLPPSAEDFDDFLTWAVVGVILGGRLGFVLFYNRAYYLDNPLEALMIWHGGMSFHGGLIGVVVTILVFAWRRGHSPFLLGDLVACAAPIGIFFGRIANFINGELFGRVTDVPWAMVFPHPLAGPHPRHPSQLYEAVLEGLVLFVVLFLLARRSAIHRYPGFLSGVFFLGYATGRIICEFFRQYDSAIGLHFGWMTTGQLLSLPMLLVGAWFIWRAHRAHLPDAPAT